MLLLIGGSAVASAPKKSGKYVGDTSIGTSVSVKVSGSGKSVKRFKIDIEYKCSIGGGWSDTDSWPNLKISNGRFGDDWRVKNEGNTLTVGLHARFANGGKKVKGSYRASFSSPSKDTTCTTGKVRFNATLG
jgi:hypothetical protein